jgi:hypothetical protein
MLDEPHGPWKAFHYYAPEYEYGMKIKLLCEIHLVTFFFAIKRSLVY